MVKCHLSKILGEKKIRVADVAKATGINRSLVSALYYERAKRVDFSAMEKLCRFLGCEVGDLFEFTDPIEFTDQTGKGVKDKE